MKFSCEKAMLSDAISICIHAVNSKTSIAALEGLLITAGNRLTMCGYNLKTAIKKTISADISEQGTAVINARMLWDIIRKMPDDYITIAVDDTLKTSIKSGTSEFNIMASDSAEYPELPDVEKDSGIILPNNILDAMINRTIFAVSDNESKPIHTGSLFEVSSDNLTMVSVDGYRLAIRREKCQNVKGLDFKFVVPGEALREISRILPDNEESCSIYPQRKHALFEFDETVVTTRLLEGEFLNYNASIPQDSPISMEIEVKTMVDAVERVSLIVSERLKNPVRFLFEESTVKLSCVTAVGRSYDEVKIPFCEEAVEIGFNNRYILDAFRACSDEKCLLELKSGLSPCIMKPLEGNSYLYLVLPVRLKAGE